MSQVDVPIFRHLSSLYAAVLIVLILGRSYVGQTYCYKFINALVLSCTEDFVSVCSSLTPGFNNTYTPSSVMFYEP